ncbi:MAG: sterol desaturase family protein [Spirochaetia bacterium]|nr:sterol desaturase family protein [Spirochaetia bacterium]
MIESLQFVVSVLALFLLWTCIIYWLHRISHIKHAKNPLWIIHRAHHRLPYFSEAPRPWPRLGQYFFWLGNWKESLDVIFVMTIPLGLLTIVFPAQGACLLVFHYFYEVFLSESRLDHNPYLTGRWTKFFAWGSFHLVHHVQLQKNFCLMITLWDHVFGSAIEPDPDFPEKFLRGKALEGLKERRALI